MDLIYNLFPQMQKNKWDIRSVFSQSSLKKTMYIQITTSRFVSLLKEAILS